MTVEALAAWVLTAMIAWNPPSAHREGERAATERYTSIAHDVAAVALDGEEPSLFEGPQGRPQTALLIASVASMESNFREDVDSGKVKGDHGKSWCILQIQVHGKTAEEWTGDDLVQDRKRCLRAGLHRMRDAFKACKQMPLVQRLSAYTAGSCKEEPKSEWRMRRALNYWKVHPFAVSET